MPHATMPLTPPAINWCGMLGSLVLLALLEGERDANARSKPCSLTSTTQFIKHSDRQDNIDAVSEKCTSTYACTCIHAIKDRRALRQTFARALCQHKMEKAMPSHTANK